MVFMMWPCASYDFVSRIGLLDVLDSGGFPARLPCTGDSAQARLRAGRSGFAQKDYIPANGHGCAPGHVQT